MKFRSKISDDLKMEMLEKGIAKFKEEYFKYSISSPTSNRIRDDISDDFTETLARDSVALKSELRDLLRKHPTWNEQYDCCVINGNHTHNPRVNKVDNYILHLIGMTEPSKLADILPDSDIVKILYFFYSEEDTTEEERSKAIELIEKNFPKAYAKGKKKSKVLREICNQLGIIDESPNSTYQKFFALAADEVNAKKIDYKLILSINPAHFLSMSNPKYDSRKNTMVSCHSFNDDEYKYNCGDTGYARDDVAMIVFTVKNPNNPEEWLNRKTSRCMFFYKPKSGVLLQSRLYIAKANDSYGGVSNEVMPEVKEYRELVQSVIAECEGFNNLWVTKKYVDNDWEIEIEADEGFGGYPDWEYGHFNPFLSIQNDFVGKVETNPFVIGNYGLCIKCGDTTDEGLYCYDCNDYENKYFCDCCEEYVDDVQTAYRNNREISICDTCRDDYFYRCDRCDELVHEDDGSYYDKEGMWLCDDCKKNYYTICNCCGERLMEIGYENYVLDKWFDEICLCDYCFDNETVTCEHCERVFMYNAIDDDGLCAECREELDDEEEDEDNEDEE